MPKGNPIGKWESPRRSFRESREIGNEVSYHWTSCPVGTPIVVAHGSGWLFDRYVGGIPFHYVGHGAQGTNVGAFTGDSARLFRFGGDVPPMTEAAHGTDIKIVGAIPYFETEGIAVKADSPIQRVKDLKGKKVSLFKGVKRPDYYVPSVPYRDFILSLEENGLTEADIVWTRIPRRNYPEVEPPPIGRRQIYAVMSEMVEALLAGVIDATVLLAAQAAQLELEGKIRTIYRLPPEKAGALIFTVTGDLIKENPDLVKRCLSMLVEAGQWAQKNPGEARRIYARDAGVSEEAIARPHPPDFHEHLVPELSPNIVAALKRTESFLKDHGFADRGFQVENCLEDAFLEAVATG